MKKYNLFLSGVAMIAALSTLTSCEWYNKYYRDTDSTSATETQTGNTAMSAETQAKRKQEIQKGKQDIVEKIDTKAYTPEEFAKGVVKGDWSIETVFGQNAVGEKAPYLKFDEASRRVYGSNGCNTLNAGYEYNPKDFTLTFSNMAVTMMMCHKEGITDIQINQALNETRTYSLTESEDGYEMTLYNEARQPVMTLSLQNINFLNGTWRVVTINGEPINNDKMKLVFDIDEHKIHGNTGCNVLNGNLETDMDAPNTFSIESLAVTRMLCPQMEHQTIMLVALERACRAKPLDKNRVALLNSDGETVITLERTSDK